MSKHTPGPWTAIPRLHLGDSPIIDEAGDSIALVRCEDVVPSIRNANARLIAAAPDMLAACEAAVRRLSSTRFNTAADADIVTQLLAAIAKAKGETK